MIGKESDEHKKTTISDRDETRIMPSPVSGAAQDLSAEEVEKIMKEVGKKKAGKKEVGKRKMEARKNERELPDDRLPSEVVSGDDDTTVFLPAIDPDSIRGLGGDSDGDEDMATVVFQAVDPNVFKKELTEEELERIVNEVGKDNPRAVDDRLPSEVGPDEDEKDKKS